MGRMSTVSAREWSRMAAMFRFWAAALLYWRLGRVEARREASINDVPIAEADRRIFGPRPQAERGQSFPLR